MSHRKMCLFVAAKLFSDASVGQQPIDHEQLVVLLNTHTHTGVERSFHSSKTYSSCVKCGWESRTRAIYQNHQLFTRQSSRGGQIAASFTTSTHVSEQAANSKQRATTTTNIANNIVGQRQHTKPDNMRDDYSHIKTQTLQNDRPLAGFAYMIATLVYLAYKPCMHIHILEYESHAIVFVYTTSSITNNCYCGRSMRLPTGYGAVGFRTNCARQLKTDEFCESFLFANRTFIWITSHGPPPPTTGSYLRTDFLGNWFQVRKTYLVTWRWRSITANMVWPTRVARNKQVGVVHNDTAAVVDSMGLTLQTRACYCTAALYL